MPHDLRMLPAAVAVWTATWVATAEQPVAAVVVAGVAVVLGAIGLRRGVVLLQVVALLLVLATVVGLVRVHAVRTGPVAELAAEQAMVSAELVTRTDLQLTTGAGGEVGWLRGELRVVEGRGARHRVRAPVVVLVTGDRIEQWRRSVAGQRLRVEVRLAAPDRGSDVTALARVRGSAEVVADPGPGLRLVERVRAGLREAVEPRRPDQRALVPALVLGDTSLMTEALSGQFVATGLVHLTAVSGANLTLLLAFLLGAARAAGVRGWWLRLVGLAGVAVFVALCRTEPSVLRAAAMGLVALAALGLGSGGGRRGLRHLCVAVTLLLLVDPWLSRSIGMSLSVLASAGIVWWGGSWARVMERWLPRWVAQSVAVPLAAQLATQPVVTAISGQVSLAGLVANMAAAPFVGPATVAGFAAAGASLLWAPLAEFLALGSAWSAQGIITVARLGAALPGALWTWPVTPWSLAVLVLASVLIAWAMPTVLRRWWCCLGLALLMVLALLRPPVQPGWPPGDWFLIACDVGQGDAVLLRAGPESAVVVDVGPDPAAVDGCLRSAGVRSVPLLVLTHFHADHVDGLPGLLAGRDVGAVLVSPLPLPAEQHSDALAELAAAGLAAVVPAPGSRWQVGEVEWQTLGPLGMPPAGHSTVGPGGSGLGGSGPDGPGPDASGAGESGAENDASLVGLATVQGVRVLLTGDIEPPAQLALTRAHGPVRADVLKIPHHGSANQDPAFLTGSGAVVALASAAADNSYGHPAASTVGLLESEGMRVLSTAESGAVALQVADQQLSITVQR